MVPSHGARAKSYFDGFLKEAGKDHFAALKKRVGALWSKFFGDGREVAIASGAHKVSRNPKYSLSFSIVADAGGRRALKLLVADATSRDDRDRG
jgi:hypothetical protein